MFAGAIWVQADQIEFTAQGEPADRLGDQVLSMLLAEPVRYPVRDWLTVLAVTSGPDVGRRLGHAGYLTQARSRWRGATRWVPADPDAAFAPLIRVRAVMDPARPAGVADAALAGLAAACGLGPRVLPYGPPDGRRTLDHHAPGLAQRPARSPKTGSAYPRCCSSSWPVSPR